MIRYILLKKTLVFSNLLRILRYLRLTEKFSAETISLGAPAGLCSRFKMLMSRPFSLEINAVMSLFIAQNMLIVQPSSLMTESFRFFLYKSNKFVKVVFCGCGCRNRSRNRVADGLILNDASIGNKLNCERTVVNMATCKIIIPSFLFQNGKFFYLNKVRPSFPHVNDKKTIENKPENVDF